MKENINEHDKTKEMMDIIRNGFKSKLIKEADELPQTINQEPTMEAGDDLPEEGNQEDTIVASDEIKNQELKKIADTIDPRVEITDLIIYPYDSNVRMEGIIMRGGEITSYTSEARKYSGIYFQFDINDGYKEPELINLKGDVKVTEILKKIPGVYDVWRDYWVEELTTNNDYKPAKEEGE